MSLLNVQNIAKRYGSVIALRSADLAVEPGEIHALLGANGAGKSTLVKILTGVIGADSGTITLAGKPLAVGSPAEARAAGLASVFQDPALVPDLTVRQNMRLTGTSMDGVQASLRSMELSVDPDELVGDLPLAMLRMIDLARALSHDPQLLLLDEITAALPSDLAERVLTVARELRDRGRSVLFVSHRLAEVTLLCDRATVLRDGRAVGTLKPSAGGEERIVELMLGESHDTIAEEIAQAEETAQADEGAADAGADDGPPALQVSGLKLTDASPEGVDFEVRSGEIVGVAALDAQGQEELFNLLAGLQRIRDGQVERLGKPIRPRDPYDAIKEGMVLVPSDRLLALLPDRPIRENIAAPLYSHFKRVGPVQRPPRGDQGRRRDRAPADRHPRPSPGTPAQRRQPAEADDRALARGRLRRAAVLRPHARHRRRHEAPDLRAAARARRPGRRRAALHQRADGDPARLRPRARAARRAHQRPAARVGGQRGAAAALGARTRRGGRRPMSAAGQAAGTPAPSRALKLRRTLVAPGVDPRRRGDPRRAAHRRGQRRAALHLVRHPVAGDLGHAARVRGDGAERRRAVARHRPLGRLRDGPDERDRREDDDGREDASARRW